MKEGFWNSLADKSQEIGYVLGAGTIAWILFFGATNIPLVTNLLGGAAALVLGGALARREKTA